MFLLLSVFYVILLVVDGNLVIVLFDNVKNGSSF